jgi:hypothetical protein
MGKLVVGMGRWYRRRLIYGRENESTRGIRSIRDIVSGSGGKNG